MLETVWQDVRYGCRSLRRAPGFAAVAVGSLAVGVGFAVFIFSFVQQAIGFTKVPAAGSGTLVDVFTNQLNGTAYGTSSFPAFARKFWPGEPVVGKHFHAHTPTGRDVEIVGVSDDYAVVRPGETPTPYIHYPVAQDSSTEWQLLVRSRSGTAPPIDRIRRELIALDAGLLFESASMTSNVTRVLLPLEAAAAGLSIVGVVTILFAAIGLYAVISFMVARRSQEFGIRMAVGASPAQVLSFVIRHGLMVGAVGIAVGAIGAGAAARLLSRTLYGVSAGDLLTWMGALIVVFEISLVAHAIPARRAASINPAIALRAE